MDTVVEQDLETAGNLPDFLQALHRNLQDTTQVFPFPDVRSYCGVVLDAMASGVIVGTDPHQTVVQSATRAGEDLLILASQAECTELLSRLLAYGVSPDCAMSRIGSEEYEGVTPLINAAWNGQLEVCRLLVESGANIEKDCKVSGPQSLSAGLMKGWTALLAAAQAGHVEVVR